MLYFQITSLLWVNSTKNKKGILIWNIRLYWKVNWEPFCHHIVRTVDLNGEKREPFLVLAKSTPVWWMDFKNVKMEFTIGLAQIWWIGRLDCYCLFESNDELILYIFGIYSSNGYRFCKNLKWLYFLKHSNQQFSQCEKEE